MMYSIEQHLKSRTPRACPWVRQRSTSYRFVMREYAATKSALSYNYNNGNRIDKSSVGSAIKKPYNRFSYEVFLLEKNDELAKKLIKDAIDSQYDEAIERYRLATASHDSAKAVLE